MVEEVYIPSDETTGSDSYEEVMAQKSSCLFLRSVSEADRKGDQCEMRTGSCVMKKLECCCCF